MVGELKADTEFDRWISPIQMKLGTLTLERVKASSIPYVPERLQRLKVEAYKPKVVSIGPLNRGTSRDLLYMEDIKWRCMMSLIHRGRGRTPQDVKEGFNKCSQTILNYDEVVRAIYMDDIKLDKYELAKIMLIDGCFLLELLISNNNKMKRDLPLPSDFTNHGAEVGTKEEILSDLKLLENQIPLFILDKLLEILFPQYQTPISSKIVDDCVLSLFSRSSSFNLRPLERPEIQNAAHFLELIHSFITKKEEQNKQISITILQNLQLQSRNLKRHKTKLRLKCCATRLVVAGVRIEPLFEDQRQSKEEEDKVSVLLGCDKTFNNGITKLNIQPLHISEITEVELRNLIAWEQSRTTHEKLCSFSEYVWLLQNLVCCEDDIKLLKTQKVLVNEAEDWSNEDLMKFFQAIVDGIQIDLSMESRFGQMINDLNQFSGLRINHRILWHHCLSFLASTRYKCRSRYQTLKRDHTPTVWKTIGVLAAIVLLLLTVAQTVFAAIGL